MQISVFEIAQMGQFVDNLTVQNITYYFNDSNEQQTAMEWVQAACCWWVRQNIPKDNWRIFCKEWGVSPNTMMQYSDCFAMFYNQQEKSLYIHEDLKFTHHLEASRAREVKDKEDAERILEEASEKGWTVPQLRERLTTGHDPKSPESKALNFFYGWTKGKEENAEELTKMWVSYCEDEGWPVVEWVMGRPAQGQKLEEEDEERAKSLEFIAR